MNKMMKKSKLLAHLLGRLNGRSGMTARLLAVMMHPEVGRSAAVGRSHRIMEAFMAAIRSGLNEGLYADIIRRMTIQENNQRENGQENGH